MCVYRVAIYKDNAREAHMKEFLERHSRIQSCLAAFYRWLSGTKKKVKGSGNQICLRGCFLRRCRIEIFGEDNWVEIGERCVFRNCHIYICGNHNRITIGKECRFTKAEVWVEDDYNQVNMGHNIWITGKTHLAVTEGKRLQIGNRCLLAEEITMRTGDSHSIFEKMGNRCNPAADISVGEHVWIGQGVYILKGVTVGEDAVIGTGAVVTRSVPEKTVAAGNPARVIKEDIAWDSERV